MSLSEHFSLDEFTRSETAARHDIHVVPDATVTANLTRLCELILEPLRAELGAPLVILSGYRPPALNALVGGSAKSDHLHGSAADIVAVGRSLADVGAAIQRLLSRAHAFPLKQGIVEFPPNGWVHVSVQPADQTPHRELLTAYRSDGKTLYTFGFDWSIHA